MTAGQWILVIVLVTGLALLLWWRLRPDRIGSGARLGVAQPRPEEAPVIPSLPESAAIPSEGSTPQAVPQPVPLAATSDDLRRIEGIGPKISGLLAEAGITTFAALAATAPDALRGLLKMGGVRIGDPSTWPEQAALAAAGRWEDLARLQQTLKGGRRL